MENAFIAGADSENLDAPSIELARLTVELLRAGWLLTFQIVPNEWGAIAEAEIIFERVRDSAPPRTLREDFEALRQGLAPQAPIHWKFDPFDPISMYKSVKRFHHLFLQKQDSP
ncbi:MAG TPA: hypothetical protein VFD70_24920 [Anaerolineae bacterium]|nr:hypothetical protein [Anaerolineae bacterium]